MAIVRYARVRHLSRRRRTTALHTAALSVLGTLAAIGAVVAGVVAGWVLIVSGPAEAAAIVAVYLIALAVIAVPVMALVDRTGRPGRR